MERRLRDVVDWEGEGRRSVGSALGEALRADDAGRG